MSCFLFSLIAVSVEDDLMHEKFPDDFPSSSDSDPQIDNLIELQTSTSSNEIKFDSIINDSQLMKQQPKKDIVKELEREMVEPENKLEAAKLLMELEKLIINENNPKAIELLDDLGKNLGIKYESNVELLKVFIQDANNDQKIEENLEKSDEINSSVDSTAKNKEYNCTINNLNTEKLLNKNEKTIVLNEQCHMSPDSSGIINQQEDNAICTSNEQQNTGVNDQLVMNLHIALQQLLIGYNGEPAVLVDNLSKLLNHPGNNNKLGKAKKNASPIKKIPVSPSKGMRSSLNGLANRRSIDTNLKKPVLKLRTSISQMPVPSTSRRSETAKVRLDSPIKKGPKRRTTSNPDSFTDTKINFNNESGGKSDKITFKVPILDKNKLRKKGDSQATMRRGPMKAIIPMGSMQRSGSSVGQTSITTPPKSNVEVPSPGSRRNTSTPNAPMTVNCSYKSPKTKPVAASTPDINSKNLTIKLPIPTSPRHNMSWNISPVTPNAPKSNSRNFLRRSESARR